MENKENSNQNFTKNNQLNKKDFERFFEEFFAYMQNAKDADIIFAKDYISKSIEPTKTEHKSVKGFLKELFFMLYSREKLTNYNLEFMLHGSIEKTGWFKREKFIVSENLVTLLQEVFVSNEVGYIQDILLQEVFSYVNENI